MNNVTLASGTTNMFKLRCRFASHGSIMLLAVLLGCRSDSGGDGGDGTVVEGTCQIADTTQTTEYLQQIGCTADFRALASVPLDATLSGARSVKVVLDQSGGDALYFQNSVLYEIHYRFASTHLSGNGLPVVPGLADFNSTEYYSPDRRFLLGAVTYYEGPQIWALEIAPYDTASATMVAKLHAAVKSAAFFGPALYFHPTSDAVEAVAAELDSSIPVITTDELYAQIDYQPLNLASEKA